MSSSEVKPSTPLAIGAPFGQGVDHLVGQPGHVKVGEHLGGDLWSAMACWIAGSLASGATVARTGRCW
jgi:hypothetical protein